MHYVMFNIRLCTPFCLDSNLVKGKIVVCDLGSGLEEATRAGALGAITINKGREDVAFVVPLPASALTVNNLDVVKSFINSTR